MTLFSSKNKIIYKELSYKVVGTLFDVYNELGHGRKEKHYQKALVTAFTSNEISFSQQVPYKLYYKDNFIGYYRFDFLIDNKIVLEIKRGDYFSYKDIDQLYGYLKVSGLQLGILATFARRGVRFLRVLNIN